MFNLIDDVPRLEQASHWEVTKHHLQAAKHNISSDSLTPSGEDGHSPLVKMVRWTKMRMLRRTTMRMVKMVRWTFPFFTGTICRLISITHYPSKIMSNKVTKRPRTKYVLGRFVAGRNGTRELWMIILMYVFSNLRHKPGHKGQGCGVNLHVTVTKRWWGPEWKILIWILVTFNTDIDRDTHIEFCMISMLILFRQHIM